MASEYAEEIEEIQEALQSYHPGSTVKRPGTVNFPDTLLVGLFGRTGCGKTSLINSMRYAVHGKLRRALWLHVAGQEKGGGHTMYRKRVEITENIAVVDNRGIDKLHATEAMNELCAQLAGNRGYSEVVTWEKCVRDSGKQLGDKIATAVFVFSALHNTDEKMIGLAEVISIMHTNQGQYPLAVITLVDEATDDEVDEVKAALRAEGVSDSCIFTVINITQKNTKLKEEYHACMLNLLDRCLTDGDQAMIFHHHKQFEDEQRRAYTENMEKLVQMQQITERQQEKIQKQREQELLEIIEENRKALEKAQEKQSGCEIM